MAQQIIPKDRIVSISPVAEEPVEEERRLGIGARIWRAIAKTAPGAAGAYTGAALGLPAGLPGVIGGAALGGAAGEAVGQLWSHGLKRAGVEAPFIPPPPESSLEAAREIAESAVWGAIQEAPARGVSRLMRKARAAPGKQRMAQATLRRRQRKAAERQALKPPVGPAAQELTAGKAADVVKPADFSAPTGVIVRGTAELSQRGALADLFRAQRASEAVIRKELARDAPNLTALESAIRARDTARAEMNRLTAAPPPPPTLSRESKEPEGLLGNMIWFSLRGRGWRFTPKVVRSVLTHYLLSGRTEKAINLMLRAVPATTRTMIYNSDTGQMTEIGQ